MQNEIQSSSSEEIALKDIVDFFRLNQRLIVIWLVGVVLLSVAYFLMAPKKYEVKWQIHMAQSVASNRDSSGISFNSIEEPSALVQRLRFPSIYPATVGISCGMSQDDDIGEYLDGALDVQAVKGVAAAVEMKFRARSVDVARQCAEAIVSMVVEQQAALIEERLVGRREQLSRYQKALLDEQRQLEQMKKKDLSNFAYLSKLDQLSLLRSRVEAFQEEIFLSTKHPAKLTAPILVSNKPISPKLSLVMFFGVLFGFMFGMIHALIRNVWSKIR